MSIAERLLQFLKHSFDIVFKVSGSFTSTKFLQPLNVPDSNDESLHFDKSMLLSEIQSANVLLPIYFIFSGTSILASEMQL